jgi:hypothetical protein
MFTDAMIDIETTGLSPDRSAIIQIAAVRFNLETGAVDTDFFNRALRIPNHRHWDEGTRGWWLDQKREVLEDIYRRMEDWRVVMPAFFDWATTKGQLRFWGKPTHFDYAFIQSYFRDAELGMPFHYRTANDMNSFLRGRYFPERVPELQVEFEGDAHNAIFDALHQIKVLLAHMRPAIEILPPEASNASA